MAVAALFALFPLGLHAQSYPAKAIRMMVPFPAGGGSDTMGRAIGQKLAERFGQPVVVENRPGAAGSIGADVVAKAAP
ncbi:MAG TPA: tripartite tricarboxylate transporter substrate-binding protein, partial [Burkholderiales bacterium]|nr:tripartite tricarboxylate transporter substrate-binding protein [Burkholderiales bacterium]